MQSLGLHIVVLGEACQSFAFFRWLHQVARSCSPLTGRLQGIQVDLRRTLPVRAPSLPLKQKLTYRVDATRQKELCHYRRSMPNN
eukprot:2546841-Amphidinium_carterae.1